MSACSWVKNFTLQNVHFSGTTLNFKPTGACQFIVYIMSFLRGAGDVRHNHKTTLPFRVSSINIKVTLFFFFIQHQLSWSGRISFVNVGNVWGGEWPQRLWLFRIFISLTFSVSQSHLETSLYICKCRHTLIIYLALAFENESELNTDRQTDRQTGRQAGRQAGRQTGVRARLAQTKPEHTGARRHSFGERFQQTCETGWTHAIIICIRRFEMFARDLFGKLLSWYQT